MGVTGSSEVTEALRADPARAAVLCDIDGTLAPIVVDPDAAIVPAPARALLAELASRYLLVACISGRRASTARRMVGLEQLTYAGNHGLELLRPGDASPTLDPALGDRATAAASFASGLDWPQLDRCGLRLEDKGPIQAIHWRGADDPELAAQRAAAIAELAAEQGLVPHLGRQVLELRPLATIDKGIAVRRLIGESEASAALYGGDDRTDLDAFAALRELRREGTLLAAVCVGVASAEGPEEIRSQADAVVDGPEGFLDLLRAL